MKQILVISAFCCSLPVLFAGCDGSSSASTDAKMYAPRLQQTTVEVTNVQKQGLQSKVTFTGNLLPRRATRIISEIEGVVREIPKIGPEIDVTVAGKRYQQKLGISYGQEMRKDDVLVQLDTRDAEVLLKIAEAKLQKEEAELAQLNAWDRPEQVQRLSAMRDEAEVQHEHALLNLERVKKLVFKKVNSQNELDRAQMDANTKAAALEASKATLKQAQAGPTADELAVQEALIAQAAAEVAQAERTIEKATILAPYDCVITSFLVEVGDRVAPGTNSIVELMDIQFLVAEIAVPEAFVGQVRMKDQALVRAAGSVDPVPGLVIAVNDMVDPQSRTFQVRVAIDNAERQFKAGQFASVELSMGEQNQERYVVPNSALVLVEGEHHVFIMHGEQVKSVPVTVGLANETMTEIVSGLSPEDVVVVDDPTLLSDGMKVTIRPAKQATQSQVAAR